MTCKLHRSVDRKTRFHHGQANSLGLLPGPLGTCPYATTGKDGCWNNIENKKLHACYVDKIITRLPDTKRLLDNNTELLKTSNKHHMFQLLCDMFDEFYVQEIKRKKPRLYFRLHWSGDLFNKEYASALSLAMQEYPQINFWMYTRSFPLVKYFDTVKNLSLYLSIDRDNIKEGLKTFCKSCNPRLKISYMAPVNDLASRFKCYTGKLKIPKLYECPVDTGKMVFDGSCAKCKMCIDNKIKRHIYFKTR